MRHFEFLTHDERATLFHSPPEVLTRDSPAPLLAAALGGTLYAPGNRRNLASDIRKRAANGCMSMVLCLEDAIADDAIEEAEDNVVATLTELFTSKNGVSSKDGVASEPAAPLPFLFVRVRSPRQMRHIADRLGESIDLLCGFVIPKFHNETDDGILFFDALAAINATRPLAAPLRLMPILESPVMIHSETRASVLTRIHNLLIAHRTEVLAVRIGATDLSSVFGLRRSRDLTIYDVKVVSAVIADIVNILGRDSDGFVISGPVWEHYSNTERLLRPQLRLSPFRAASDEKLRRRLLLKNFDGLMHEIALDQANGLTGKTVIHPSHVPVVHALSVISHEEFLDAEAILGNRNGGAAASPYGNKMNEMRPHLAWAERTMLRSSAFGVASEGITFVELLEASMR